MNSNLIDEAQQLIDNQLLHLHVHFLHSIAHNVSQAKARPKSVKQKQEQRNSNGRAWIRIDAYWKMLTGILASLLLFTLSYRRHAAQRHKSPTTSQKRCQWRKNASSVPE